MNIFLSALLLGVALPVIVVAQGGGRAFVFQLAITVTNDGDECIAPLWFGIHPGNFNALDGSGQGNRVTEAIATEGNYGPIGNVFAETPDVLIDGVVGDAEICPGSSTTLTAVVKVGGPRRKTKFYFSYISAVGGEAFGNEDPTDNLMFRPIYQQKLFPLEIENGVTVDVEAVKTKNRSRAKLNGRNFDPEVDSPKGGSVTLSIDNDRQSFAISYRVKVTRANDSVSKVALLVGDVEVYDFYQGAEDNAPNKKDALDLRGQIEEGELDITNEELWNEIFEDNGTVVVYSEEFPDGDLLGFLKITKG